MPSRRKVFRAGSLSLIEDAPLLLFLALSLGTYFVASGLETGPPLVVPLSAITFPLQTVGAVVLGILAAYPLQKLRPGPRREDSFREFVARHLTLRQAFGILGVMLGWGVFIAVFDTVKSYIPIVVGFVWDRTFMEWDYYLHGGVHPWRILHGLWESSRATVVVDRFYFSWYVYTPLLLTLHAWNPKRRHRFRFLISFALVWYVLGNLVAGAASSAGPVYFDRVVPHSVNPYEVLLSHLQAVHEDSHLFAWTIKEKLWANYLTERGFGAISAMPSVHVAVAALGALSAQRLDWRLATVAWMYAAGILVGSVYLGWHYAIDGYVAVAATIGIWWLARPVTAWYWDRLVEPAERRLTSG